MVIIYIADSIYDGEPAYIFLYPFYPEAVRGSKMD